MRSFLPLLAALVACGGDAGQSDTADTDGGAAPTFTQVRDEVLVPTCGVAGCHGTGEGELFLTADTTAADLVGVPSSAAPGEILVVAGDPDASYLVKKIEASPDIVDDPMPPPFGGVQAEHLEMIRGWIAAGAAD